MKLLKFSRDTGVGVLVLVVLASLATLRARADVIELTNGDHYRGTVVAMTATNVVFLSEVQGRVTLPREKIAQITLREVAAKPVPDKPAVPPTNAPLILSGANSGNNNNSAATVVPQSTLVIQQMRQQGIDPKLIDQVQEQIFGKASPQAAAQFNEMINGLMSGSVSVKDIRAQAQNSIAQIKAAEKEFPEAGDMLDSYLVILQKFVNESATDTSLPVGQPAPAPATSVPSAVTK